MINGSVHMKMLSSSLTAAALLVGAGAVQAQDSRPSTTVPPASDEARLPGSPEGELPAADPLNPNGPPPRGDELRDDRAAPTDPLDEPTTDAPRPPVDPTLDNDPADPTFDDGLTPNPTDPTL